MTSAAATPTTGVSDGVAPLVVLPRSSNPVSAVAQGGHLIVLAQPADTVELSLFDVSPNGVVRETHLPLQGGGRWIGLSTGSDGSVWAASLDRLIRVRANGRVDRFDIPKAKHPLPTLFQGAPSQAGLPPTENAQASSLAVVADKAFIGRGGYREITVFDISDENFRTIEMPAGVGDVASFTPRGPNGTILFTVWRSALTPAANYDVLGTLNPVAERVTFVRTSAVSLATNGVLTAIGATGGLRLVDSVGLDQHAPVVGGNFDSSRLAMLADGTTIARSKGGEHSVVFINTAGVESRRVAYQAQITQQNGPPCMRQHSVLL